MKIDPMQPSNYVASPIIRPSNKKNLTPPLFDSLWERHFIEGAHVSIQTYDGTSWNDSSTLPPPENPYQMLSACITIGKSVIQWIGDYHQPEIFNDPSSNLTFNDFLNDTISAGYIIKKQHILGKKIRNIYPSQNQRKKDEEIYTEYRYRKEGETTSEYYHRTIGNNYPLWVRKYVLGSYGHEFVPLDMKPEDGLLIDDSHWDDDDKPANLEWYVQQQYPQFPDRTGPWKGDIWGNENRGVGMPYPYPKYIEDRTRYIYEGQPGIYPVIHTDKPAVKRSNLADGVAQTIGLINQPELGYDLNLTWKLYYNQPNGKNVQEFEFSKDSKTNQPEEGKYGHGPYRSHLFPTYIDHLADVTPHSFAGEDYKRPPMRILINGEGGNIRAQPDGRPLSHIKLEMELKIPTRQHWSSQNAEITYINNKSEYTIYPE